MRAGPARREGCNLRIGIFSNASSLRQGGGVVYVASFAQVLREFGTVDLHFSGQVTAEEIEKMFTVDLEGVRVNKDYGSASAALVRRIPMIGRALDDRVYDLLIRQSPGIPHPTACARAAVLVDFPFQDQLSWRERQYLKTYRSVIANSRFTSGWIGHRWKRQATVIHPPVRRMTALPKKPLIVAVGRFSTGRRSKYQPEMIEAFKHLLNDGATAWELHLCGLEEDAQFLDQVRSQAQGLPVHIHVNASGAQLNGIVGAASIFWHATGVAFDERRTPELMEHFGISTAEAMSAGCVPVVIGKGGQREVVGEQLADWTWQDWPECIAKTRALMENPELLNHLSALARRQASAFGFDGFQARVRRFTSSILADEN
jgi:glycosyltransferase involved in cell wall biosynthesis